MNGSDIKSPVFVDARIIHINNFFELSVSQILFPKVYKYLFAKPSAFIYWLFDVIIITPITIFHK